MNLRGTLALLLIAAGLGLYVWLVEIRGEQSRQAEEEAERRLVTIDPESVTRLELPTRDSERARLVRDGDDWRLEAPIAFPANPAAVRGALRALAELDSTGALESPSADLGVYGLGGTKLCAREPPDW